MTADAQKGESGPTVAQSQAPVQPSPQEVAPLRPQTGAQFYQYPSGYAAPPPGYPPGYAAPPPGYPPPYSVYPYQQPPGQPRQAYPGQYPQGGYPEQYPQQGYPPPGVASPPPYLGGATPTRPSESAIPIQEMIIEGGIPEEKLLTAAIDIKIRHDFIRKVYGILFCQLLVTFGLCTWFNFHRAAALWLYQNPWLMIVAAVLMCASVCTLACVPKVARKSPTNYILLGVLSLAMGVVMGYSTGAVDTPAFMLAVAFTAGVCIAVSLFACQTKWDFTGMGPYLLVFLFILIIFGVVAAFFRSRIMQLVYGSAGALVFSLYLIVDTQKIVGGKHRQYEFSIDDYAFAALALYLDIVNLFLFILQIISATRQ